jgi:L-iditol 2-dehydrogenase
MRALVKTKRGVGNVSLETVEEPIPGPSDVKIRVEACGICGTDLHVYHDTTENTPPVILGHEFTGVVTEVGALVTRFKPGDRVVAETTVRSCGTCLYCATGNHNICANRLGLGRTANGAFADYLVLRQGLIHILPDNVNFIAGALCEPLACAVHAVIETTRVAAGDNVLITGPGPIGLLALQLVKAQGGVAILCGVTVDEGKLTIAKELGADHTINVQTQDARADVSRLTEGNGADIVIECSGSGAAAELGLELLRRQGQYTQMGLFGQSISVDLDRVTNRELIIRGSVNSKWTSWERALRLLCQGKVRTEPLVTDVLPLSQWQTGFTKKERAEGLKTVLIPKG